MKTPILQSFLNILYSMENKDTNRDYQKVVKVEDQN